MSINRLIDYYLLLKDLYTGYTTHTQGVNCWFNLDVMVYVIFLHRLMKKLQSSSGSDVTMVMLYNPTENIIEELLDVSKV